MRMLVWLTLFVIMALHSLAKHLFELILIAGILQAPAYAQDGVEEAPVFSLESVTGETHSLDQYQGKYVVLEWMNFRCRTVDDFYKSRVLPGIQQDLVEDDVIWLSIVSEAAGKQGQVAPEKMMRQLEKRGGNQTAVLLDLAGIVGKTYEVSVSPHFAVIDPAGMLIYQGALDNQPPGIEMNGDEEINYVLSALEASWDGAAITYPVTEAYGCPIRYDR